MSGVLLFIGIIWLVYHLVEEASWNTNAYDGKELDVQVIAEFVETEEQRDKLLELGCEWYQGYLYSKPIPLDEFIQFIKKHND